MAAASAEINQTNSWIMGLHPVSAEVENGLIDQVVALSELGRIDPSDIGIIYSATRKPGGTIDDPMVPLKIFGSQENRLDVGKRFVLLRFDLQKSRVRELGHTANYNLQTSGKTVKQVRKVKAWT